VVALELSVRCCLTGGLADSDIMPVMVGGGAIYQLHEHRWDDG
jgi:hypothetical protein